MTQKTKSGLIRLLWEHDHWKHFWAIAAKAYSEIRDSDESGQVTLEKILKNVTGLLGVIPADEYLVKMGWSLVSDAAGGLVLRRSSPGMQPSLPLATNHSVKDVVEHCYQKGFIVRPSGPTPRPRNNMTMAFASQPASYKQKDFASKVVVEPVSCTTQQHWK